MAFIGNSRRKFLQLLGSVGGAALAGSFAKGQSRRESRRKGRYMGDFAAEKIETLRLAIIGVGERGSGHARQFATIEGTEIVGICDLYADLAERSKKECLEAGNGRHGSIGLYVGGKDEWRKMLKELKPDAVIIATPWKEHAPMAIGAMKSGAHAFVEVPLALTNEALWDIVDTSEQTGRHCMMMENVNYGREELLYLNMCRLGVIGELLHGEAAYIHELRQQMNHEERGTGSWRTFHYAKRNGNLYPTHGLGPVAQYMNLARGEDNFGTLVSFSTPALGRSAYAKANFSKDHQWNQLDYRGGDLNTSIIKTELGRTILVQWDETSPRPYSRLNLIQGTKGCLAGFPSRVALEGGVEGATKDHHTWAEGEGLNVLYEKYEHPLQKRLGALAKKMGGHGGMDFMMRYRIVECLRKGEPLDQNVYEGAFWSAVAPLSESSVKEGGAPQAFPDFTRGDWKATKPLSIIN